MSGAGLLAAIAVLCGFAAAREVLRGRAATAPARLALRGRPGRRCGWGCRSGCGAPGSRRAIRCPR